VAALQLDPSVPNPFRGATQLTYSIPADGGKPASLSVHDVSGRLVRVLVDNDLPTGPRTVTWDGTDEAGQRVPGGVYFYELRWNGVKKTGRTLLLR
jgi:flagellar hook assembly protein FlgD